MSDSAGFPGSSTGPALERLSRVGATLFFAYLAALFGFAVFAGATGSTLLAAGCATVVAAAAGFSAWRRSARSLPWTGSPRAFSVSCGIVAVIAAVLLTRLTIFMVDPSRTACSLFPGSEFETRHSCVTAYFVAARVVRSVPSIYSPTIYDASAAVPGQPRKARMLGEFRIDQYEYPPTFLWIPRAVSLVAPDFLRHRLLWFGLSGFLVLAGLIVTARQLEHEEAARAVLLVPFVMGSLVTVNTLQKGNIQLVVIALSMIAMALVERRRTAAGGAMLAVVTMAKMYPGLLLLYLMARRQWRAVAWTGAFCVLLLALTFADIGWQPFVTFRQQLPGLLSGEAFPAFRNLRAVAVNQSIPGIVFKLKLLGVPGMDFDAMRVVGSIFMLFAAAATILLARRSIPDSRQPLAWMVILILATLRSPFLPQSYGSFPSIWLLTLLVATALPATWGVWTFLVCWALIDIYLPNDIGTDPRLIAVLMTLPQILTIALTAIAWRAVAVRRGTAAMAPV
jgi:hypothetical protein